MMNESPPPSVLTTYLRNAILHLLLDLTRAFLIKIMSVLLLGCDDVVLHEASPCHTHIPWQLPDFQNSECHTWPSKRIKFIFRNIMHLFPSVHPDYLWGSPRLQSHVDLHWGFNGRKAAERSLHQPQSSTKVYNFLQLRLLWHTSPTHSWRDTWLNMVTAFKHFTSHNRKITQKPEMNKGTAITGNPSFNLQERSVWFLDINQVTRSTVPYFESRWRPNKPIKRKRPLLVITRTARANAEHLID
jgi:hypothetical protein